MINSMYSMVNPHPISEPAMLATSTADPNGHLGDWVDRTRSVFLHAKRFNLQNTGTRQQ